MQESNINIKLLIKGCRNGNRNSQRILYEYFMSYALSICLRYSKNKSAAEEVLNDGFLKVFKKINQYDSAYPFRFWLRKIMINSAIDNYRANQNKLRFLELNKEVHISENPVPLPSLSPDEDVLPILQKLSPVYRMVFNLSVMEGYKHDEIAEKLGISASTSRSNLVRAKEQLKKLMLADQKLNKKFKI